MISLTQYGQWLPADTQTPISLYLALVGEREGILLESAEVDGRLGRYSLIAYDYKLRIFPENGECKIDVQDARLADLKKMEGLPYVEGVRAIMANLELTPAPELEQDRDGLPPLTRGLYGFFGFGTGGMLERKLTKALPPEEAEAELVLPGKVVLFDHTRHRCCFLTLDKDAQPTPVPVGFGGDFTAPTTEDEPTVSPSKKEYCEIVEKAKELITNGEAIQIVLSTRFSLPLTDKPFNIYRRLRQENPSPFMFYMQSGETTLLGSSPELMVRCADGQLEVRPIAGTRHRGETEKEDQALAKELLADPKERAEHVMLVDLGRNDVGRIGKPGSVEVDAFMNVERFSHVMHLTSYVHSQLKDGCDAMDVMQAAFPAGTVSGAPKIRAMEIIAELEDRARGPYAGAIGWFGLDKDTVHLDTGIIIRSMWIRDGKCYWQAGAGIVYDSVPEKEWQECHNKAKILRKVIKGKESGDVFTHR
ncbi:MAG: anthranilate synthase component I family protein [Desulfovibrio sp.]